MTLEEAIKHEEEVAEGLEEEATKGCCDDTEIMNKCYECAKEHRQLAEWLRELKAYKELNTYNRSSKCSKCEYEDSAYYCDDCIFNFVNKFKLKEVNVNERDSN